MDSGNVPSGHGQDSAALLLAVAWTECAISSIFVTFRFYCRKKITKNLWWDDWFILITFVSQLVSTVKVTLDSEQVFAIISSSLFTGYALNGGTRHILDVQPAQIPKVTAFNYVSQGFCMLALSTGKVSVALLIYRLQAPTRWRTWLLAILSGSSFFMALLVIALFLAQCSSLKALWTPHTGTCWDPKVVNDFLISAFSKWKWLQSSSNRADLFSRLLGPGRFYPRSSPTHFPMEAPDEYEEESATLGAHWIRGLVSAAIFDSKHLSYAFHLSASICAAFKAYYLSTLIGKADSTCESFPWSQPLQAFWQRP